MLSARRGRRHTIRASPLTSFQQELNGAKRAATIRRESKWHKCDGGDPREVKPQPGNVIGQSSSPELDRKFGGGGVKGQGEFNQLDPVREAPHDWSRKQTVLPVDT